MVEYDTDSNLDQELAAVLENESYNEFQPLRENNVEIKACFVRNLNGDGELQPPKGQIVNLKKVPAYFKPFCENLSYLIVVDEYGFREATAEAKRALLHKALMGIEVAISASGEVKLKGRKPDVIEYGATVSRFGVYDGVLESFQSILSRGATQGATQAARAITNSRAAQLEAVTNSSRAARLEDMRSLSRSILATAADEANADSEEEI